MPWMDGTPKCDLHRHLGGSISPETVYQIIKDRGLSYLGESLEDIQAAMQFRDGEPNDFHRFLDKFKILDEIPWDEETIALSIKSVCDGLAAEHIDHAWIDFSINKYMSAMKWHKHEAIKFIHSKFEEYAPGKVSLILSLKYESMRASQRQYAQLIDDAHIAEHLLGIDLVGDEAYFDKDFYKPIFQNWRSANKIVRAHVAESQAAANAWWAIKIGATNIAHGIKTPGDPTIMIQAGNNDICFDLALTSNYLTNVWSDKSTHPICDLLAKNQKVTLGSDDPVQCSTTLDREFMLAKSLGVTDEQCRRMQQTAAAQAGLLDS